MGAREAAEWMKYASDDLDAAHYLLGMETRKIEIICYHCQQSAEKAIKALYALHDLAVPKTHDFRTLVSGLPERHRFSQLVFSLAQLQPFAVAARYPYEMDLQLGDDECAVPAAREALEHCRIEAGIDAR